MHSAIIIGFFHVLYSSFSWNDLQEAEAVSGLSGPESCGRFFLDLGVKYGALSYVTIIKL